MSRESIFRFYLSPTGFPLMIDHALFAGMTLKIDFMLLPARASRPAYVRQQWRATFLILSRSSQSNAMADATKIEEYVPVITPMSMVNANPRNTSPPQMKSTSSVKKYGAGCDDRSWAAFR